MSEDTRYCGYVALIGRPNVGKSTLLNRLVGEKISITSNKPQTTRHRLLGIETKDNIQIIYVDTPGLHFGEKRALNKAMNQAIKTALADVDVAIAIFSGPELNDEDKAVLQRVKQADIPVIIVINKIDKVKDKTLLLPSIDLLSQQLDAHAVIPLSAKTGENVEALEQSLMPLLPENPHFFAADDLTDRPMKFLLSEMVREKIFRLTGKELPHFTTVLIEHMELKGKIYHIHALILVEREGQKQIIIGKKGDKLKIIGSQARVDMEALLEHKVFLKCWVKVKSGWSDSAAALHDLGYTD